VRWVTERLVPTLGRFDYGEPNSIVILDNASVHHSLLDIVKALFYEAGAIVIFLSPYSPDLNPIEQCFKHLKAFFKRKPLLQLRDARPRTTQRHAATDARVLRPQRHCS
jgi:transposase